VGKTNLRGLVIAFAVVAAVLLVACGTAAEGDIALSASTSTLRSKPATTALGHGRARPRCRFALSSTPGFRDARGTDVAGPLAIADNGYWVEDDQRSGVYRVKVPIVVEGGQALLLAPPRSQAGRVGFEIDPRRHLYGSVRVGPCRDRPRVGWPMGLWVRGRAPLPLKVRVGSRTWTVTLAPRG
jgi:hypothetical protein